MELHGANGYLIDQFLRATTNRRTDAYGGGRESRGRFLREVVEAVADAIGEAHVGLRVSPRIGYADADDPEMAGTLLRCAGWLDEVGIAYLHLAEADASFDDLARPDMEFRKALRDRFTGPIAVAHQYDVARAEEALGSGLADLVAFGRPFIANPDLVERMAAGAPPAVASGTGAARPGTPTSPSTTPDMTRSGSRSVRRWPLAQRSVSTRNGPRAESEPATALLMPNASQPNLFGCGSMK